MRFIKIYQIDKQHSIDRLLGAVQQILGCIYLHDAAQPVIGLYPKTVYFGSIAADKWLKLQRQTANFGYGLVTFEQQSELLADIPELIAASRSEVMQTDASDSSGFGGGWMGYIGYDLAAASHGIASVADKVQSTATQVDMLWGEYDIWLRLEADGWVLAVTAEFAQHFADADADADAAHHSHYTDYPDAIIQQIRQHPAIADLIARLQQAIEPSNKFKAFKAFKLAQPFAPLWTRHDYNNRFAQVQAYLYAGDAYQINLTQAFRAPLADAADVADDATGELWQLADELWQLTRAPYAAYLRFDWAAIGGVGVFEILSCSPELFIAFADNRRLITRPIKGTLVRLHDADADARQRQRLADSSKDQAENVMIVDLLRNDLSKYAEIGSVRVPHLFEIESFEQVHHMVSEIEATLRPDVNSVAVLLDSLPGGSITGAPKIRAMQIIAELEQRARGAYCGSMGYLNHDGRGRFNILIRTLQRSGQQLEICAGGGITVASDLAAEYQESLDKVAAILHCLNAYAPASSAPSTPESAVHADGQSPL